MGSNTGNRIKDRESWQALNLSSVNTDYVELQLLHRGKMFILSSGLLFLTAFLINYSTSVSLNATRHQGKFSFGIFCKIHSSITHELGQISVTVENIHAFV